MQFSKTINVSLITLLTSLIVGCEGVGTHNDQAAVNQRITINAALNDPSRLTDAKTRDQSRMPAAVLTFSGIAPGDRIAEIAPAGGYYTGLLSRVVGQKGRVYAVDPERIFEHFPSGREGFPTYIAEDPRANVTYSSQNLDEIDLPDNLDQIWMVLYYHDTLWTGEDRAAMNQRFFDALKSGGSLIVIDHSAATGAPAEVGQTLHRMDPAIARTEISAAGFTLEATSEIFSRPGDDLNASVFSPEVRGNTDRFVWKWTKP